MPVPYAAYQAVLVEHPDNQQKGDNGYQVFVTAYQIPDSKQLLHFVRF